MIGTNKSDAAQTVRALLADLCPGGVRAEPAPPAALADLLAGRAVAPVSYADWLKVERAEAEPRRLAGPRRAGEAGQPRGHRRALPRRVLTAPFTIELVG